MKKWILIGSGLFVIIVLLSVFSLLPKTTITIAVAPEIAYISIDNTPKKQIKNSDSLAISPGKHLFEVSQSGFDSYKIELNIEKNKSTEILVALNPQNDIARKLLDNEVSQQILQRFYGKIQETTTNKILVDYPLTSILPIDARLYIVYVCQSKQYPNDISKVAICIDVYKEGLEMYIQKDITSRGYNLDNYEVIYIDKYSTVDQD